MLFLLPYLPYLFICNSIVSSRGGSTGLYGGSLGKGIEKRSGRAPKVGQWLMTAGFEGD